MRTDETVLKRDGQPMTYSEAQDCECRIMKIVNARLPAEYAGISLATLQARPDNHPKQAEFIEQMRQDPGGSYIFSGAFGAGKSHFFWALYVEAVRARKKLFAGTLRALIDQYHKAIEASQRSEVFLLPIYPEDLRSDRKCALFLDDLDKARPTEYVAEQLFELLDAAISNNQQVVVTTNLSPDALITHFERADNSGRFGGSIVRRLLHNAHEINMF